MSIKNEKDKKKAAYVCRDFFKDFKTVFNFNSYVKTGAVLFFFVGRCRFFMRGYFMFFFYIKCSISKGNALGMFHL